ncbi:hypothetical protein PUR71_14905 [Streptomyces sp. SP17BM10]|uniref:hypothetical protein n=1 Tax=Streptomyces sp. SP17BM10 TaxID=3002530 RepID=UPI002E772641|nr:hypothetical protein [Streptomyces sp. SP17BM10]MEE1784177.1 hypothetical protein [Streptomyces sp. SP17BM10]
MGLLRRSESKPTTRTDTPATHVDPSTGRTWTADSYDEARANGRVVHAPRTTHSNDQLGRQS